jgi:hypothetical protein
MTTKPKKKKFTKTPVKKAICKLSASKVSKLLGLPKPEWVKVPRAEHERMKEQIEDLVWKVKEKDWLLNATLTAIGDGNFHVDKNKKVMVRFDGKLPVRKRSRHA